MNQNAVVGLMGVLGVWLTAGLALPFVNRLTALSAEQLLLFRGAVSALLVMVLVGGNIWEGTDQWSLLLALCFALASLGLYRGIRAWGVSRTIIVVTLTPVVNFLLAWERGTPVPLAALLSLMLILGGVMLALRRQEKHPLPVAGFAWSLLGVLMNGLFYEFAGNTTAPPLQACFWQGIFVLVVGGLGSLQAKWSWWWEFPKLRPVVIGFAVVGGFLYFLANLTAFSHLDKVVAAVLVQGETPAVILMARVLLDEQLSRTQWLGAMLALMGAAYLSYSLINL